LKKICPSLLLLLLLFLTLGRGRSSPVRGKSRRGRSGIFPPRGNPARRGTGRIKHKNKRPNGFPLRQPEELYFVFPPLSRDIAVTRRMLVVHNIAARKRRITARRFANQSPR